MKAVICAMFVFGSLATANAQDACKTSMINSQLTVHLTAADQRKFEIKSCKNGGYTAVEVGAAKDSRLVMQMKAISQSSAELRFIRQNGNDDLNPSIRGTWNRVSGEIRFAQTTNSLLVPVVNQPEPCEAGSTWNPDHGMCMPDNPDSGAPTPGEGECPVGQTWNPDHGMCMPTVGGKTNLNFHINQFLVGSSGSGPRGRNALSAPNMWMLEVDHKISSRNTVSVNWMGSSDKWTVPKGGYPLLLQTGEANAQGVPYVDAQHPHTSPIMGLTFSDIIALDTNGKKSLTFFFAPRGEATAGPTTYMHRASADTSPDAPLGHHMQDVFHITSTVVGAKLKLDRTELEASIFSGVEPSPSEVTLDTHRPDSYAFRINQMINTNFSIGGSYANVKESHRIEGGGYAEKETTKVISAWINTRHKLGEGQLSTATIYGTKSSDHEGRLNSFLEEFVFELGKSKFFGRVELVQRTPEELNIEVTDGHTGAQWVKPITLGYARTVYAKGTTSVEVGSSVTKTYLPKDYRINYGGNPVQGKAFLKLKFNTNKSWGALSSVP